MDITDVSSFELGKSPDNSNRISNDHHSKLYLHPKRDKRFKHQLKINIKKQRKHSYHIIIAEGIAREMYCFMLEKISCG